jgi:hypothetical protein
MLRLKYAFVFKHLLQFCRYYYSSPAGFSALVGASQLNTLVFKGEWDFVG